jgi:hypothetical protein
MSALVCVSVLRPVELAALEVAAGTQELDIGDRLRAFIPSALFLSHRFAGVAPGIGKERIRGVVAEAMVKPSVLPLQEVLAHKGRFALAVLATRHTRRIVAHVAVYFLSTCGQTRKALRKVLSRRSTSLQ